MGGGHQGAVEGRGDGEQDRFPGAGGFAEIDGAVDGGIGAGDDGLRGGVEVGGGDGGLVDDVAVKAGVDLGEGDGVGRGGLDELKLEAKLVGGAGAELGDLFGGKTEDGCHGSLTGGDGFLHEAATGADGADGVGEGEGSGYDVGGVLAEGVAGGHGGGETVFGEDASGGDGDGEDRGLGVLGELEEVVGAVEDDFGECEAEGFVGFVKDGLGGREGVVEGAAHADGL